VLGDLGVDQVAPMGSQPGQRAGLVLAHQPRVAGDIGSKDSREPPLDPLSGQLFSPISKGPANFAPLVKVVQ
jgi:hypothetical protein